MPGLKATFHNRFAPILSRVAPILVRTTDDVRLPSTRIAPNGGPPSTSQSTSGAEEQAPSGVPGSGIAVGAPRLFEGRQRAVPDRLPGAATHNERTLPVFHPNPPSERRSGETQREGRQRAVPDRLPGAATHNERTLPVFHPNPPSERRSGETQRESRGHHERIPTHTRGATATRCHSRPGAIVTVNYPRCDSGGAV